MSPVLGFSHLELPLLLLLWVPDWILLKVLCSDLKNPLSPVLWPPTQKSIIGSFLPLRCDCSPFVHALGAPHHFSLSISNRVLSSKNSTEEGVACARKRSVSVVITQARLPSVAEESKLTVRRERAKHTQSRGLDPQHHIN